jgi:photosystem II stability/assembly factor-like uncharacterized protein
MGNFFRILLSVLFFSPFFFSQSISWQQLSGPHGGAIYSIVTDNSGNIYANTVWGAGPFKSTDDGETWFSIKGDLTPYSGEFHPMSINSSGGLFIGGAHSTALLCRSTDGGSSWEPLNNLNPGSSIICISFDNYENVYVGTGIGIYKSTDNGDNWAQYGMNGSQVEAVAFNSSGHVFAGTSTSVYRSTNDGASWTQLPTSGGTRTVAVAPNGYIFAGCQEGGGGIWRSTNNGDNWTRVYAQPIPIKFASTIYFDTNGDIYSPTWGNGVIKSTDSGDTWTEFNEGLGYKYVRAIGKSLSGPIFAGTDYGIYKTNYPVWYSVGLPVAGVSKILMTSDNNIYTAEWGLNRSTDYGQTWETINNGLGYLGIKGLTVNSSGYLFASTTGAAGASGSDVGIFRSTNKGESWEQVFSSNGKIELASGSNGEIVAVSSGYDSFIKISTDDGLNWNDISYGTGGAYSAVMNSARDIFVTRNGGVDRKLANDTVWTNCPGAGSGSPPVIFIANNGYIYTDYTKSTDNGDTWTTNNFPTFISSYAENSLGHLFIGTYNSGQGVYRTTDYAETWEQINTGLPIMDIRSVAVDAQDYLYAGSWGMSMFKTTISTFVSVENIEFEPTSFSLEQNYPNPFNPSTTIKYSIPELSKVKITLFNLLSEEVTTIVNEEKNAGNYSVEFNASSLPSGVYFYQLQAGNFIETKKMILLK